MSNDTLHVTGIPVIQNTMLNLVNHFSKFGKVKLVKVQNDNDPRSALITFENCEEAKRAYNSPTPVLNDRMIQISYASTSAANKSWPCEHCGKILASKQNLGMHIARMHAGVTCSVCSLRFETVTAYEKHYNVVHSNIKSTSSETPTVEEMKPFSTENFRKLRRKYNELKKKIKKRDKANYKLVKFNAKNRKKLEAIIQGL